MAELIGDPRPNDDRAAARIEEWTKRVLSLDAVPEDIAERGLARHVIGQDEAVMTMSVLMRQHVRRLQAAITDNVWTLPTPGIKESRPTLLIGPSGCGKTLLGSRAARMMGLPYACQDLTALTATGWVGRSTGDLVSGLIAKSENQFPIARWGVLFLDEFDKLRSRDTAGPDVGGGQAQMALLGLLDGTHVELEWPPGPREARSWYSFSTANLMVLLAGAFSGLDEIIAKRIGGRQAIGFGAGRTRREALSRHEILRQVAAEDLICYGIIPEVVGRLNIVVMDALPREALRDILLTARDGPLAIQQRIASREGYFLKLKDDLVDAIVDRAMAQGLGARPLHPLLAQACRRASYEVPSRLNPLAEGKYTVTLGIEALVDGSYQLSHRGSRQRNRTNLPPPRHRPDDQPDDAEYERERQHPAGT